ncbi:AlpA family transcriptional regulator [Rhizobium sp. 18055]|uniref:helix-turn-helix transcriptional regulator n=1 Tax=Rhizobium sp. 18055 TaxID=2681403 RepID=UPI001357E510|nr:helix-turn-helix domain-containing protein [Rhizobium sp. 18055]
MSKLLDIHAVVELVPVSRVAIWRWVKAGRFPAPLKVGNLTFWRTSDIEAFIAAPAPSPAAVAGPDPVVNRWAVMLAG